jgi:hypothetical protein
MTERNNKVKIKINATFFQRGIDIILSIILDSAKLETMIRKSNISKKYVKIYTPNIAVNPNIMQ